MNSSFPNDEMAIDYLLGALDASDMKRVEDAYFADDDFFAYIEGLELELIRDYLRGELPPSRRILFERKYLESPALSSIITTTGLLARSATLRGSSPQRSSRLRRRRWPRVSYFRLAMAGGALVVVLGAAWLFSNGWPSNRPLRSSTPASGALVGGGPPEVIAFAISPGMTRSGKTKPNRLVLSSSSVIVRFDLKLPGPPRFESYRVQLESVSGELIRTLNVTARQGIDAGWLASFELPAESLPGGDYVARLRGGATERSVDLATYTFGLVHR